MTMLLRSEFLAKATESWRALLIVALVGGLAPSLGALFTVALKHKAQQRFKDFLNALAAGVLLTELSFSILLAAIQVCEDMHHKQERVMPGLVLVGFLSAGALFAFFVSHCTIGKQPAGEENEALVEEGGNQARGCCLPGAYVSFTIGLIAHNIPEGLALITLVLSRGPDGVWPKTWVSIVGKMVVGAVEGLAATNSLNFILGGNSDSLRWKSALCVAICGWVELLAVIGGAILLRELPEKSYALNYCYVGLFAFGAGAMFTSLFEHLIPRLYAHRAQTAPHHHHHNQTATNSNSARMQQHGDGTTGEADQHGAVFWSAFVGYALMLLLDLMLASLD